MSEKIDRILLFNGLSALFLTAAGVELLIYFCQDTINQFEHSYHKVDSTKRISRWRDVFKCFCEGLLEDNSMTYSYERMSTGEKSNPFDQHAILLIQATRLLIKNHNDQELGPCTMREIKSWFSFIDCLKDTNFWGRFTEQTRTVLTKLHDEFDQNKKCGGRHEYPHFNAEALLIRCSYIIHIRRNDFSPRLLHQWEVASGLFLSSSVFKQDDYFPKETEEHVSFPYISNFPSKRFHEIYNNSSTPLAVHGFFEVMKKCVEGQMMTINANLNLFCFNDKTNLEMCQIYAELSKRITTDLDMDFVKIKGAEKQRRHLRTRHCNKRRKSTEPAIESSFNVFLFGSLPENKALDNRVDYELHTTEEHHDYKVHDVIDSVSNHDSCAEGGGVVGWGVTTEENRQHFGMPKRKLKHHHIHNTGSNYNDYCGMGASLWKRMRCWSSQTLTSLFQNQNNFSKGLSTLFVHIIPVSYDRLKIIVFQISQQQ